RERAAHRQLVLRWRVVCLRRAVLVGAVVAAATVLAGWGTPVAEAARTATRPSAPSRLTAAKTATSVTLRWRPAGEDVAVRTYSLWLDGTWEGTNKTTRHTFDGLSCGTVYILEVATYDTMWNLSPRTALKVTTSTCSGSGSGGENGSGPGAAAARVTSSCRGAAVAPGSNLQAVVDANPPGATFCIRAGVH